MRCLWALAIVIAALCTRPQPVRAETVTFSEAVALQPTGWTQGIALPQFDPAMGALNSAVLTLTGHIEGTAAFESMDTASADVTLIFAGELTLNGTTLSSILSAAPELTFQTPSDPFDGTIDFGGTSGRSYADLAADAVVSVDLLDSFTSAALYTGTGTIPFVAQSAGDSYGNGSGNLLLNFQQSSSALAEITYGYSVPEPGTLGLMAFALAIVARRRPIIRRTPPRIV